MPENEAGSPFLSDEEHAVNRRSGAYLCRCPRPLPDDIGDCATCHRLVKEDL